MTPGHALVAGGGIGGMAAGLALVRRGWEVTVLERAPEITEIGAGVQIGPNGVKVLEALGAMDRLRPHVYEPERIEMRDGPSGATIFRLPMGDAALARWGARYYQVHRADLLDALMHAFLEHPKARLRTGTKVRHYRQNGRTATLILEDTSQITGDLAVGADGIRSTIRASMFGPDKPKFTGNVAWRAVVPVERLGRHVPPPAGCVWAGPGKHAVTTLMRGGSVANFVGIVEERRWGEEGWYTLGDREDALRVFGDWSPVLRAILEEADPLYRWALFGRPVLTRWSDGAVALLGDAAHPMVPSMAQGAVQALEDAWVLAEELETAADAASGAEAYFRRRIKRTTAVQKRSLANLRMFHQSGLPKLALHVPMRIAGRLSPGFLQAQQDWIFGHDVTRERTPR